MENIQTQEVQVSDLVYQQDKAAVDMQIATAKAYPRNLKRSLEDAIAIVSMDRETAATCIYSLPRGGKAITGPSVHLAKIIAQTWGNMRIEAKVIEVDQKQITSQAVAFDLEKNLAIKVEVKRSIVGKSGRYNDDMITVTGNAANAIALRNAILSVIPRQVIDKLMNTAKETITGDISDETKLIARRKAVIEALKNAYKVTEEEIMQAVGKASVEHIDKEDIITLIGIGQAIKDGDTTVSESFRPSKKQGADAVAYQKESTRIVKHIEESQTLEELQKVKDLVGNYGLSESYLIKHKELQNAAVS